ncbi:MAG: sterol desaturase family protein [Akkermansiaceae bacterium]
MFSEPLEIIQNAYSNYWNYLVKEISNPSWNNYFYWLIGISLFFFLLEIFRPWREDQPKFRKDFWLDTFYMFFNFFIFSLVIYHAGSELVVTWFTELLASIGITNLVAIHIQTWSVAAQLFTLFILRDFIHWNVHRLLHRVPWLWEFHKVHHSVEQMGFAAHLRYHWMENVVYRVIEYIPLALIGFGIENFIIVHIFTIIIGHFNHSNIRVPLGPLKYIFNNPQMHIWHHARKLPKNHRYGMNFGLSLSIWDYLFRSAYIPRNGKDITLGFHDQKEFPKTFLGQMTHGFRKKK